MRGRYADVFPSRLVPPTDVMDQSCHSKHFGAKGYGHGTALVGEYASSRFTPTATIPPLSPPSTTTAPSSAAGRENQPIGGARSSTGAVAMASKWKPSSGGVNETPLQTSNQDGCRRCGKVVYFAEAVCHISCIFSPPCLQRQSSSARRESGVFAFSASAPHESR